MGCLVTSGNKFSAVLDTRMVAPRYVWAALVRHRGPVAPPGAP